MAAIGQEGNGRSLAACLADIGVDPQEVHINIVIVKRIGDVKNDDIDPCIGQKLRIAADHPLVIGHIVTVERFTPMMKGQMRTPFALPRRILQNDAVIVGAIRIDLFQRDDSLAGLNRAIVGTMPEVVKNAHELPFPRCRGTILQGQRPPQSIHGCPGVTQCIYGLS